MDVLRASLEKSKIDWNKKKVSIYVYVYVYVHTPHIQRGMLFVFNSHEELGLLGASNVIESKVAPRIAAFINLEAGKLLL